MSSDLVLIGNPRIRDLNMPQAKITLHPQATPGYIHAKRLTTESAKAAITALQANRDYHIFTSDKALIVNKIPHSYHNPESSATC